MANQSVSPGAQQIPAAYANERDYAPGWVNEKKIKTALTPFLVRLSDKSLGITFSNGGSRRIYSVDM